MDGCRPPTLLPRRSASRFAAAVAFAIALSAACGFAGPAAWAQTPQRAAPARAATLGVTLTVAIDTTELGDVEATVTRSGQLVSIAGQPLIELLRPAVRASKLAELRRKIGDDGAIRAEDAAVPGIALRFDINLLRIEVEVDNDFRQPNDISLMSRGRRTSGFTLVNPAPISGFVNLRSGVDYVDSGTTGTERQPAAVSVDGALNGYGTVLEWGANWKEQRTPEWQRDDVRLVQDFPEDLLRVTAGDVRYGLEGFQSSRRIGGITLASNYTLQPNQSIIPAGSAAFDLQRASRVEVFLNGQRVQALQLGPGRYNLRDFPFASGSNDVEVRITDEVGRVETIRFPFVFETTVLGEGIHEYSYAIGVPANTSPGGRQYDPGGGYVFSGFHNYGVTDQFTVGGNFQTARFGEQVGANARLATILGTFRTDVAGSRTDFGYPDYAARLQYRYSEGSVRQPPPSGTASPIGSSTTPYNLQQLPTGRSLSANFTYRGAEFSDISVDRAPTNPIRLDYGFNYGQRVFGDWFGNAGYSKQLGRDGAANTDTYTTSVSTRITDEITLSVFGTRRVPSNDQIENALFVGLSWMPVQSRHRYSVSRDTRTLTNRATWSYTPLQTVGGIQGDASVEKTSTEYHLNGSARYVDYRYEAALTRDQTYARAEGDHGTTRTSATFGTAIVFAGAHVGVSRPINDSFVLIAPHPRLSGQSILVNPVDNSADAKTDWLGAAVIPGVPAYRPYQLSIEAPDLPVGYDLGEQVFNASPTYKSGTLIEVGTGGTVMVDGTLLDPDGQPLGLYSGHIISLDEPDQRPIAFFTNRAGRFRVLGMFPGRFEVRLDTFPNRGQTLVVPKDAEGMYNAGTVHFPTH
ncbi:MAG: fimbria/pilus outer membrane usher protein [Gemmatimonas sp.]